MRLQSLTKLNDVGAQPWDAIVIGSGLGGMTTATLLAMARRKVSSGTSEFTTSDKCTSRRSLKKSSITSAKTKLSGSRWVRFMTARLSRVGFTIRWPGESSKLKISCDNSRKKKKRFAITSALSTRSEEAELGFLAKRPGRTVGRLLRMKFKKWAAKTTFEVILAFKKNPELISAPCVQCGDYGLTPKQSGFGIHAVVVDQYMDGASDPVGGSKTIHESISRVFEKFGGTICLRSEVDSIVVDDNRAIGLDVFPTGENTSSMTKIFAPIIVSNAGYRNTWSRLLKRESTFYLT